MTGVIIAWPALLGSVLFTNSIWLTLISVNLLFLLGEGAWAPNITMMQRANPPEKFGSTISVYAFFNYLCGSVATALIGFLINRYSSTFGVGKILSVVCSFAYASSIASWYKAG